VDIEHASGGAGAAAGTWDEHATRYAGQERLEARAIEAALRLADPLPQDRVVDLATGTGLLLRALAAASPSRWGGLRPLDPTAELGPAGLVATHRVVVPRGGYPSLVVRARVA